MTNDNPRKGPPERIWLQYGPDATPEDIYEIGWGDPGHEVSWAPEDVWPTDVEYKIVKASLPRRLREMMKRKDHR